MSVATMTARVVPVNGPAHQQVAVHREGEEEEEDLVDYYLRTTSYYRQTILSTKLALASVWKRIVVVRGVQQTKENLKSFWTTLGVVSALLLGVTYPAAVSPITSANPDHKPVITVIAIFGGTSLVLNLVVVIITVIYMVEIENTTTDKDLAAFILANGSFFDVLAGFFSASVTLVLVMAMCTMYITYGEVEFWVIVGVVVALLFVMAPFAAIVAGRNRFCLWARYESPLAVERAARDKRAADAKHH